MTESNISASQSHSAIGVVKFSQEKAGYPDVKKIADVWVKDPYFKQVIIRKVSQNDYGIQFIYLSDELTKGDEQFSSWFMNTFIKPHKEISYAHDVSFSSGDKKNALLNNILKDEKVL